MAEVLAKIKAASQISDLQFYEHTHTELARELLDVDEYTRNKVLPKLSKMEETFDRCVKQMQQEKEQLSIKTLFDFLAEFHSSDAIESMPELPSRFQTWIKGEFVPIRILEGLNRDEIAMVAAILHDMPFAQLELGKEARYKEIQLQLMAEKLQSGETVLPEAVLAAFVGQGPFSDEQQASLVAMQNMYLNNAKHD